MEQSSVVNTLFLRCRWNHAIPRPWSTLWMSLQVTTCRWQGRWKVTCPILKSSRLTHFLTL